MYGWDGDDLIFDGEGTEAQIWGGNGDDSIRFSFLDAGEFADGGAGTDQLGYSALARSTTIDLAAGYADDGVP